MIRLTVLAILSIITTSAFGGDNVKPSRQDYINLHKNDAIRDMLKTGVPASITMAQACLESQDGCSPLAREANNHFGIKCSDWTGPSYIQDDDKKDECFRKYNSTIESYDDHSQFLKTRPRYAFLFQLDPKDYKSWAHGLKKAGYATDPTYANRLIKIIEDNQLYLLDDVKEADFMASINKENEPAPVQKPARKVYVPSVEAIDAFSSRKVTTINGIECVYVKNGDDLRSLAKELNLGYWQLPRYNELSNSDALKEGQIIFLQPKKKTGLNPVYIVKPGDSIQSIAQENGIKVKYIYKYNDLKEGIEPEPGTRLYLSGDKKIRS